MKKWNPAVWMSAFILAAAVLTGCGKQTEETAAETTAAETEASAAEAETADEDEAEEEDDEKEEASEEEASESLKIVYTNDIHGYIYNVTKDKDNNEHPGLRLSKIKAMVDDMRDAGENVLLVDAGDEIQGNVYGAVDEGKSVIKLMNATGFQAAVPGNHEFDYGMFRFFEAVDEAEYPFLACNFRAVSTKEIIFPDYQVFELGDKKVALIGIMTPETITSSTPKYFQDEKGEYIYTVEGISDPEELYSSVQCSINRAKNHADYVIALGHLGDATETKKNGVSSEDVIAHTTGLNALIDAHSHTTREESFIKDQDGNDVLLTQTGAYLAAVGIMDISEDGTFSSRLVNDYERADEDIAEMEEKLHEEVSEKMGEKIAELPGTLHIFSPDDPGMRLIRSEEMNLGDLAADAVYWFFNNKMEQNCDIAIANSGGVRAQLESGDLSYLSAKTVEPFGNQICLVEASGQQILDGLELGANVIGKWDAENNRLSESGGFLQVAGLKYTVDASVPSSVRTDDYSLL